MRTLRIVAFTALLATALAAVPSAGAALIGIYRNTMESKSQLGQIAKLSGERCGRSSSGHALKIVVGKQTKECSYRTPVFGRDLEIAATERLLSVTPMPVQRAAYLAVDLRSGEGARYQLAVYPLQRKAQLRKILTNGSIEYLDIEKNVAGVGGADRANALRLRAFNLTEGEEKGHCQILGFVGGRLVSEATDAGAGELTGRASGFSVGSAKIAKGAQATVDDVVVRVPSPF
ncbi:MAG: hypothetical protein ACRDLL_10845 [Solirubrobacterales bacterium]